MPNYRRNRIPGATYFFTLCLADRTTHLLTREAAKLGQAIRSVRNEHPFHSDAWVLLPDHLHTVWTLPENDSDYSGRWRAIKKAFTKSLSPMQRERNIWQRRFWEHTIRDERDYAAHMDYVHFNPVKHGFVAHPAAWPFSSFRRCVAAGLYPATWTVSNTQEMAAGEPRDGGG